MALWGSDVEIWTDNWTVTCTQDDMWRSQYSRMLIGTNHRMRLDDFQVKGSNSDNLFNGFGWTEVDTDSCTWNWDREWTVTCTWNDIWLCWYSEMLISTHHCLRFENFELRLVTRLICSMVLDGPRLTPTLAPQNGTEKGLSLAPETTCDALSTQEC